ncbi:MAG: hypothetical protein IPO05_16010 [Flavobacteriales bacterium]|nr:hypothetical protein [Flavobacteriales bacterium]
MPDQEDEAAESLQTSIKLYSSSVKEAESFFIALLVEHFGFQAIVASEAYKNAVSGLKRHIDRLRDDCWLLVETEYIDKVYRDSYYRYYSSKTKDQPRNCLRVSVFYGRGAACAVSFRGSREGTAKRSALSGIFRVATSGTRADGTMRP